MSRGGPLVSRGYRRAGGHWYGAGCKVWLIGAGVQDTGGHGPRVYCHVNQYERARGPPLHVLQGACDRGATRRDIRRGDMYSPNVWPRSVGVTRFFFSPFPRV